MSNDCFICDQPCNDEDYCEGCGKFVCVGCDELLFDEVRGEHEPEDHIDGGGEYDDE